MARANVVDGNGRAVALGRELGRGGEGSVFEVVGRPDTVAKIYHHPLPSEKCEKLRVMAGLGNPSLLNIAAWPTGILSDRPGGELRGIFQPRVSGHQEVHFIYSPAQRRQHFPKSDWSFLVHVAMNCAAAVQTVHESGHVIGDVNQGGFLVSDQGTVRLIDCDSFQVRNGGRTYRCIVGVPHYTPPELQSVDFKTEDRDPHHDSFGLGVLIFHLLFMGRHPFAGRYLGQGDMPIERAIAEGRFAFSRSRRSFEMELPPYAINLDSVTPSLSDMFERTFRGEPRRRPSSKEWYQELNALKLSLRRCPDESSHTLAPHVKDCPWCQIEEAGGPAFFKVTATPFEFDPTFDLFGLLRQIEQLPPCPARDEIERSLPSPPTAQGRAILQEALFRGLGPIGSKPMPPELVFKRYPELPVYQPELDESAPPERLQILRPVPKVPPFVPYTVPSDPSLQLLSLPKEPAAPTVNHFQTVRQRYRDSLKETDYRTTKWGALLSLLLTPAAWMTPWPIAALLPAILCVPFAICWLVLWIPKQREYRSLLVLATQATQRAEAEFHQKQKVYQENCRRVEAANTSRQAAHAQQVTQLHQQRAELPRRNAELQNQWETACSEAETLAVRIRQENEQRLLEWKKHVQQHESRRRELWKKHYAEIQHRHAEIDEENGRLREAWDRDLQRYHQLIKQIDASNDQRITSRREFDKELFERRARLNKLTAERRSLLDRWIGIKSSCDYKLSGGRQRLDALKQQYLDLKAAFEQHRNQLTFNAQQGQLEDHLRQRLIETAQIQGVGKKRKDVLAAFGIETAYDINPRDMMVVNGQGFGPKLINALYAWRGAVERSFRFDPSKIVIPPAMRALHAQCHPQRSKLQQSIRQIVSELKTVSAEIPKRRQELLQDLSPIQQQLARATADVTIAEQYAS